MTHEFNGRNLSVHILYMRRGHSSTYCAVYRFTVTDKHNNKRLSSMTYNLEYIFLRGGGAVR